MRNLKRLAAMLALMAMLVVSTAFPAVAYHHPDCWAFDEDSGWYYWCDDVEEANWGGDEEDCWEWSDVFEEFQWEC